MPVGLNYLPVRSGGHFSSLALTVSVYRSFALMQKNQKIKAVKKLAKNCTGSLNPPNSPQKFVIKL